MKRKKLLSVATPTILLLIMLFEIVGSISWQSTTWDEGDHLFAGYMSLKKDDNSLNPEHPPMAKMVAALPLLPLDLKVAPHQPERYFKDDAYLRGRELIYRNGPVNGGKYSADTILFRSRMAVSVFTFALALLVFFAGWEMFSLEAGVLAMTLFAFEPSILANGAYVTTDMTVACMLFAAVFGFYRYVKVPSASRLLIAGVLSGMALAAKHSAVLLLPMLIVLAAGELIIDRRSNSGNRTFRASLLRMAGGLAGICAIAIFILWAFYSFRYAMRPDGSAMTPSLGANAAALTTVQNRGIMLFAKFHLLPESYLYGLVDVMAVADLTPSYIFGKVYAHGVWFYFPVVLALKWTIGAMGIFAMALWVMISGKLRHPREVLFLTVPPIIYLATAITSPLNIGVRHVLPIFAFLLTLSAGGAWAMVERNRRWGYAIAVLLLAHIVSSARVYPNYLPYANEFFGGPAKANYYLTDSAVDWGQQLKTTKQYLDEHHIKDCWFAYTVAPFILPSDYGIPCKMLPTLDTFGQMDIDVPQTVNGPVLMSYLSLNGYEFGTSVRNPYQELFYRKPDAVISDGVAVYDGSFSFPLASALQYVHQSGKLLEKDPVEALRDAQHAVALAPNDFDPVMAMGDALRANGKKADAASYYGKAREIVKRMEPSAQKDWNATLNQRMASVK